MRIFDRPGRPSEADSRARTRALIGQLAAGASLLEAARAARVKPERALALLDDDVFFATYCGLRARTVEAAA